MNHGSDATLLDADLGGNAREVLRSIVDRIQSLEEKKREVADDIKEVYVEARSQGFDVKTVRAVIKMAKMDKAEREAQEALLETYMQALGMLAGTPLGRAAIETRQRITESSWK